jgi:hypothetical protein
VAEIPGGRIAPTQRTPEEDDPDGRAPHVSDRVEKPTARRVECLASGPLVSAQPHGIGARRGKLTRGSKASAPSSWCLGQRDKNGSGPKW